MSFILSEKYRLELHWSRATYDKDQIAFLDGCYFSGPVLSEVFKLNDEDYIDLDFAAQYVIFVDNYYVTRLSWKGVKYTPEKIELGNVTLKNLNLNATPKLNEDDYIVIDTKKHEDIEHIYNLYYPSYLIRVDGTKYNFKDMR